MINVKSLSDEELKIRCTEHYTEEEMRESILRSEEQIGNGNCIVYGREFLEDLKRRKNDH